MIANIHKFFILLSDNKYFKISLLILTLLVGLATISLATYSFYYKKFLFVQYEQILHKKLNYQIDRINAFLDENKKNTITLTNDPHIIEFISEHKSAKNIQSKENDLYNYLINRQEKLEFKSVSLINNDSTIIFSTNPLLRGVHLNDETFSTTPIYRSFFVASMTLSTDFSDYLFSSLIKQPAFYIAMPLINKEKVLGVLVYQVDEKKLDAIVKDYLDLGETGETVLSLQYRTWSTFITSTRNDPYLRFTVKEISQEETPPFPVDENGTGIKIDYREKNTFATWSFIPRVDWLITVKIDLEEILAPITLLNKYVVLGIVLSLFLLVLSLIYSRHAGKKIAEIIGKMTNCLPAKIRHLEFFLFLLFLCLSILSIYQYKHASFKATEEAQELAISRVKDGIEHINEHLFKIRALADFIAEDLRTERLVSQDIRKRLRREIVETEGLVRITIAYAPFRHDDKRLYAPSITERENGAIEEQMIGDFFDYTDKNENSIKTGWYLSSMESKKPLWLDPSVDPIYNNMKIITYSRPFYFDKNKEEPAGVIAISYKLPLFSEIAQTIGIGETGYSFILSKDQTFLYHPSFASFSGKKTLEEFAHENNSEQLEAIAQEIKKGQPLLRKFSSESIQSSWIYAHPIGISDWVIATVFNSNEIGLAPSIIKAHFFIIIICSSITLLLLLGIICRWYARKPWLSFLVYSNFLLAITLVCLWFTIIKTSQLDSKSEILITNETSVDKFMSKRTKEAIRKNENPPIFIPCGLELYSLQQVSPKDLSFSGYIWHRYHKTMHKDIERLIRIPQASSFNVINKTTIVAGDWTTIRLNVSATIYQELDYAKYPFEKYQIIIPIEHSELEKSVILVPDLMSYISINPYKLPGLDTTFSKNSFNVVKTFFDYTRRVPNSDQGVRSGQEISDYFRLGYNSIMTANLFVPFLYFFLPLIAILIAMFAVLILETRATSSTAMIGTYTGLLFSLVLLHRALYERAPSSGVLYMEYAFLFTYIILILLVVHTVLVQRYVKSDFYLITMLNFFKAVFWPIQLAAWIITTFIIFY